MAKKKRNKPTYIILPNHSPNIYAGGGGMDWGGAAGNASSMLDSIIGNAQVAKTPQIDSAITELQSILPTSNTNTDLMSEWSNYKDMGKVSFKDVGGKSNGQIAAGTGKAALAGAAAGTAIMPGIGCVCDDTIVYSAKGEPIKILDLNVSDGIIGYIDNGIDILSINGFKTPAYKECFRIETAKGIILECSHDHPIMWSNSDFYYSTGSGADRKRFKNWVWKYASSIKKGDLIAIINEIPLFGKLDVVESRMIGMLIGDGSYGKDHGVRYYSINKELQKYAESFGAELKNVRDYSEPFNCYVLKGWTKILKKVGILYQVGKNKRLPKNWWTYNKESLANLIGGLYDTDGCVNIDKDRANIKISLISKELIEDIRLALLRFGVLANMSKSKGGIAYFKDDRSVISKDGYVLTIRDKNSLLNFYLNIKLLVKYKLDNLNKISLLYKNKKGYNNKLGVTFDTVKKVTPLGIRRIYNLEASNSHTYLANNIVTHNTVVGGVVGAVGGLVGGLFGRKKANKKRDEANRKIAEANENALNLFDNKIGTIESYNDMSTMAKYFNFGGSLHTQGTEFPQGLTYIDEGGLHEENPNQGVLLGMDEQGAPNLLELGEVKFNNYVFSNRLKPTKDVLSLVNLKERYKTKTFADIAKLVSKESKERPNDPISKLGLEDAMSKLMIAQEEVRGGEMKKEATKNMFKLGGVMNAKKKPNLFPNGGVLNNPYGDYDPRTAGLYNVDPVNHYADYDERTSGMYSQNNTPSSLSPANTSLTVSPNGYEYKTDNSQYLRYAPVLGAGITLAGDLLGKTNRKDYTHADSMQFNNVDFLPIGNYMTYNPLDRNYYTNQLRSLAAAGRSAIVNQSGGNRATATAGLLASDYNTLGRMGDLIRMAEEYNLNQRLRVEEFNRGTNMYNSEAGLKSAMFNSEGQYNASAARARMKQEIDDKVSAAKSANYSNFFESLGGIGQEAFARNMINSNRAWYYGIDSAGGLTYKPNKNKKGGSLTFSKI